MTAVADAPPTTGRVVRVIGPVVDIEFPRGGVPPLFNALHVEVSGAGDTHTLTLEVALHLGDDIVRSISMQPTDGLVRGAPVTNTGAPISVSSWVICACRAWLACRLRLLMMSLALSVAALQAARRAADSLAAASSSAA